MSKTNWGNVNQWLSELDRAPNYKAEGELIWKLAQELGVLNKRELIDAAADFTPQLRAKAVEGLIIAADAYFEDKSLLPLIFGVGNLEALLKRCRKAYPDFDLIMGARWGKKHQYLELCAFFHPRKGGPGFNPSADFPRRPNWDIWEYFWSGDGKDNSNQIDQMLEAYPTQSTMASKKRAEAWELKLDEDPDLFFVHDLIKAQQAAA